jgi:3-isopropylmalate/(R)-2-methylmalate dehydratase small subunit
MSQDATFPLWEDSNADVPKGLGRWVRRSTKARADSQQSALRAMLEQSPGSHVGVDLEAQKVTEPDGTVDRFEIDPFRKDCLLAGTDDISFTLGRQEQIAAFEKAYETKVCWL